MCLKRVEKKKLLGCHNKAVKWFNYFQKIQKQPPEVCFEEHL